MANVLISHRGDDAKQAETLADEIRNAGHNVWFDVWEIGLGDSIIGKMAEGLENADYVVVCYSKYGLDSPWMQREWMSTLNNQLMNKGAKLLPIILSGGAPPAIMADFKYADLTTDWSQGISELINAIK